MCIRDRLLIDDEINEDDANAYLNEVIFSQILINQLEPALTGIEYFESILHQLTEIHVNHPNQQLACLLYTSPSPRDRTRSRMPSSA